MTRKTIVKKLNETIAYRKRIPRSTVTGAELHRDSRRKQPQVSGRSSCRGRSDDDLRLGRATGASRSSFAVA